ncbi:MAG: hypothetical protein NC388_08720 [Clostridium sp.]|nr:hypothetical protein [Clostridium sp.]
MNYKLTFVPAGGLCNRMRTMASVVTMMGELQKGVRIVWFRDSGLNATFSSLFEPLNLPLVRFREARWTDLFTIDRPRTRNFHFTALWLSLFYPRRINEYEVTPLRRQAFDFKAWADGGCGYMSSYSDFYPYDPALLRRLFVPRPFLQALIDGRCAPFASAPEVVGVHVRRTDHPEAWDASPLEAFFAHLDAEVIRQPEVLIYLATDDEQVKAEMKRRYPDRVITSDAKADRTSQGGIVDAVVDLYALARTNRIYGSWHSSFSDLAAQLGDIPLIVAGRESGGA